ncbi:MAG TPA: type II toxin-antitoxin system RelB/DinJ family antitoxin [Clostridia bacterium]|nr:type II toxin-antitoxin system RelB/DinJ family antitoxin [Clostridia bacterium]
MAKTANVYARIEPGLKREAEKILDDLGIPASNAVTMFYKQIVLHKGLPFEVKIPEPKVDFSKLSQEEIDEQLNIGHQEYLRDETVPAQYAFAEIREKYGVKQDK